jgi:flavin reductase (DIM6/NTAB) family NADH-FMN oxidoreductase RutF
MSDQTGPTDFDLRAVRRRWASGVAVVTTVDGDDGYRGATVSAFTAVSLEPPLVLVCIDRAGRMSELVPASGAFVVSILESNQEFLAERFAGRAPLPDKHFAGVPFRLAGNGCPILDGAHAWYACRVAATHDGGDHVVVIGAVDDAGIGPETDDPLLTYDARYRRLEVR